MTCHLSHRPHRCPSECLRVAEEAHRNVTRLNAESRPVPVTWPNSPKWRGTA